MKDERGKTKKEESGESKIRNPESEISDLASHCIRCGFCLESCPTFVETGVEMESPRGRIYLVRSAEEGKIAWEETREHLDLCLGCRACETACPSGVEYGAIFEIARDRLERTRPHRTKLGLLRSISSPSKLRLQLAAGKLLPGRKIPGFVSRALSGEAPEAERPRAKPRSNWPTLDEAKLPPVKGEVYLLEGCAMRVLFPRVHEATRRLLRRIGYQVKTADADCCGALHAHNGYLQEAEEMRDRLLAEHRRTELPILVNSAGCGSWLKDSGAGRSLDVAVFLHQHGLMDALRESSGLRCRITYHDACHLSHGQGVRNEPRELLKSIPGIEFVELEEADRCCGSAGIYNVLQPKMARRLLDRKWRFIQNSNAEIVALGNPGCHAWIDQAARESSQKTCVLHTMEILEASFSGICR